MTFGERLRAHLKDNNYTQAHVAECTGIDVTHISHYINGQRRPNLECLQKILKCVCQDPEEVQYLVLGK